ncbi:MAG: thioredoxin domain-containing protein [Henriciella sp.]
MTARHSAAAPRLRANRLLLMAMLTLLSLTFAPITSQAQTAQAPVKIINLTADWCASCHEFEPKLARALETYTNAEIELINLDLTHLRAGPDSKQATIDASKALLRFHKASYLWDWYGGSTGMAIMIASDTGEPISCVDKAYSVKEISDLIQLAGILARKAGPGRRRPDGADCPAPMRQ